VIRATLSSLWAHKARMTLTAIAVVLGVAFVVGTFVFTDTLQATFEETLTATTDGVDVRVDVEQEFGGQFSAEQRDGVPADMIGRIRQVDGVRAVEGEVVGYAQFVVDGEPVGDMGAPTLGLNAPAGEPLQDGELRAGRYPAEPGEVAVDAGTAGDHGLSVGDEVEILTGTEPETHVVTGVIGFGELDSLAGATVAMFDPRTAMDLYSVGGDYLSLKIAADTGVDAEGLRDRIAATVGDGYAVRTGAEAAAELAASINEGLGFFTTGLLVFAGVSLFVGAFIIANTFSIVVAQRTRELALMRAIGASRRQVLGSVLTEAVVVGLAGSAVGVAAGAGLALALQRLLAVVGLPLPSGSLVVNASAAVIGLVVGVTVTTVSALAPAVKATRIPPVAALTAAAAPPPPRMGAKRIVAGVLVAGVGGAMLGFGLFGQGGLPTVGAGAGVLLIGLALLAALVARPVIVFTGWPIARFLAIRGELARENALRNPRRTAATASALMIGLGLVTFASIFGASLTRSAETVIDEAFQAEYVVRTPFQGLGGLGGRGR
jgi:putative ABC transport system permease protein